MAQPRLDQRSKRVLAVVLVLIVVAVGFRLLNSGCVDINTASTRQLDRIVHIGPVRAEEIVQRRPFGSVRELTRVNGIAQKRLRDIEEQGLACVK